MELAPHLPGLKHLDMGGCTRLADEGIQTVVESCGQTLQHLDLSFCLRATDQSMVAIGNHCHVLGYLSVQGCDSITDKGICGLLKGGLTTLKTLVARGLDEVDGSCSLHAIKKSLTYLEQLDFCSTQADSKGVSGLAKHIPFGGKGEGKTIKPLSDSIKKFNIWLIQLRTQSQAANVLQSLVRRYLLRCSYYQIRTIMIAASLEVRIRGKC